MKSSIVPIFIAIVSLYIIYRTYDVHQNYILADNGTETLAKVKFRNVENNSIQYIYEVGDEKYITNEIVDEETYNEHVPGDNLSVYYKINDPNRSIIKENKMAFSFVSISRNAYKDPLIIPLWVGYTIGAVLLIFSVIQFLRKFKKTTKTFD